jgi:hypothetical protein
MMMMMNQLAEWVMERLIDTVLFVISRAGAWIARSTEERLEQ